MAYWFRLLFVINLALICGQVAQADEPTGSGKLTLTCLNIPDVQRGAGLAVVIRTPSGRTYLYDTGVGYPKGDGWEGDHNTARDVIVPFLKANGVQSLDGIAISHAHYDHFGGLLWLVDHFPVKKLIDSGYTFHGAMPENYVTELDDYARLRQRFADRPGAYQAAHAGDTLDWGAGLKIEVLAPPKTFFSEAHPENRPQNDPPAHYLVNANSLGLRIQHGQMVFLLPGDIQAEDQLQSLLPAVPAEKLKCHVLMAPGHGIHAVPEFAAAARPEITVASVHARYGKGIRAHKVYGDVGSKVLVTGIDGTVQFVSDGATYAWSIVPPTKASDAASGR